MIDTLLLERLPPARPEDGPISGSLQDSLTSSLLELGDRTP